MNENVIELAHDQLADACAHLASARQAVREIDRFMGDVSRRKLVAALDDVANEMQGVGTALQRVQERSNQPLPGGPSALAGLDGAGWVFA
jgi:hypothetical protein